MKLLILIAEIQQVFSRELIDAILIDLTAFLIKFSFQRSTLNGIEALYEI